MAGRARGRAHSPGERISLDEVGCIRQTKGGEARELRREAHSHVDNDQKRCLSRRRVWDYDD